MHDRFVYLNGQIIPKSAATLDIEDRGAMFADGVYEVTRYYGGVPFAMAEHIQRLKNSLAMIRIPEPADVSRLGEISDELMRKNQLKDAIVYWQVTRGPAPRRHPFPAETKPTMFVIAYSATPFDPSAPPPAGKTAILQEDIRWSLCCVKSLMLLPNVLARQAAEEQGAYEAILHRGDIVTEGAATSVGIVRGGELWTHPANQWILPSITRATVLDLARKVGVPVIERAYTVEELLGADEVIIMGTTSHVTPIVSVGGKPVGKGVWPVATKLHEALAGHIRSVCGL